VLWSDNQSPNLGVRVLAQGTSEIIRSVLPGATVDYQDFEVGDSPIAFNAGAFRSDIGRRHGPIKTRVSRYDLVADTGAGDSFTDAYGWKRRLLMDHVRRVISAQRIPVLMTPQTIGPFDSLYGRLSARRGLADARIAMARDPMSVDCARQLGARAVSATDVVFSLPQVEPALQRDVVLNISGLLWEVDRFAPKEIYRDLVRRLIRGLLGRGCSVTVLPHVLDNSTLDNDMLAISAISEEFEGSVEVIIPADLEDARRIISGARVVVASRMHACLNAISLGVPAYPLAYSRKFGPLLADLGWNHGRPVEEANGLPLSQVVEEIIGLRGAAAEAGVSADLGRERLAAAVDELRDVLAGISCS